MVTGIPENTIWLTEPLVEMRATGAEPRFSQDVQLWCDTCLTGQWRLYDEMCRVKVSNPDADEPLPVIEVDALLTFLVFNQAADEIAFRLRWL